MTVTQDFEGYVLFGPYSAGTFTPSAGSSIDAGYLSYSGTLTVGAHANWVSNGAPYSVTYEGYHLDGGVYDPLVEYGSTLYLLGESVVKPYSIVAAAYPAPVCYLRGTRVVTASGEVPVEDLQPGDVLVTRFGPLRPVKWIGKQSFDGRFLSKAGAPVRIRAGALGDNVPCRDLFVSPDHSIAIGDHLVLARLLLNGVSITQEATAEQVDYFHVDLGGHDCVIADGAWAESYVEQDNRNKFHNAGEFSELFPDHQTTSQAYCLPRVAKDAASLLALRVALLARLPSGHFTSDADVHLLADGLRVEPTYVGGNRWEFAVPAGVSALRLVTHATSPAIMGTAFDDRALGFCISSLTARAGVSTVALSPASNALHDGWYPVESNSEHVWRWTNGDAALPVIAQFAPSLDNSRDPVVLTITGACLRRYLLTELPTAVLASDATPSGVPFAMTA